MCDLCQRDYESTWKKKEQGQCCLRFSHEKYGFTILISGIIRRWIIIFVVCMLAHQRQIKKNLKLA